MNWPDGLKLTDLEEAKTRIVDFISDYVRTAKAKGVVMGLSGGIDSALVCSLAVEALGPERVLVEFLPVRAEDDAKNLADARNLADRLGVEAELFELEPVIKAFEPLGLDRVSRGNLAARMRMAVCYARANQRGMLVIGTGNKTEILTGYFTKYGDGGVDLLPIANLYKVNVQQLSEYMGIPRAIIEKPPSAGLWEGQTDEGELGVLYDEIDKMLYLRFERGVDWNGLEEMGFDKAKVDRVRSLYLRSQHKREPLPRPESR
ncbi:MAG: NAD+ synthase [Candidatus Thorarchaeota archaeon]